MTDSDYKARQQRSLECELGLSSMDSCPSSKESNAVFYYNELDNYEAMYAQLKKQGRVLYRDSFIDITSFGIEINGATGSVQSQDFAEKVNELYDEILKAFKIGKALIKERKIDAKDAYKNIVQVITAYDAMLDKHLKEELMIQREGALTLDDIAEITRPAVTTTGKKPQFRRAGYVRDSFKKEGYMLNQRWKIAADKIKNGEVVLKYNQREINKIDSLLNIVGNLKETLYQRLHKSLAGRIDDKESLEATINRATQSLGKDLTELEAVLSNQQQKIRRYIKFSELSRDFGRLIKNNEIMQGGAKKNVARLKNASLLNVLNGIDHAGYILQNYAQIQKLSEIGMDSIKSEYSCESYRPYVKQILEVEEVTGTHFKLMDLKEKALAAIKDGRGKSNDTVKLLYEIIRNQRAFIGYNAELATKYRKTKHNQLYSSTAADLQKDLGIWVRMLYNIKGHTPKEDDYKISAIFNGHSTATSQRKQGFLSRIKGLLSSKPSKRSVKAA
jgi:hypothetical protein